jgi:alpha-D-xyloside xylohydrolase
VQVSELSKVLNTSFSAAQFTDAARFVKVQAHSIKQTGATQWFSIERDDGKSVNAELSHWGEGVFRLRVNPRALPDDGLLVGKPLAPSGEAQKYRCEIVPDPLRIRLWRGSEIVLESITDEHFTGRTRLPILGQWPEQQRSTFSMALKSDEAVYGFGEKFTALNKRSQLITSRVEDALGVSTELAYKNIPFCWSPSGWGILIHTTADVMHGVGYPQWSSRSYCAVVDDATLDIFFFIFDEPAQMLRQLTDLTGLAPKVPLWSLGAWASKAYYKDEAELLATAHEFRARRFPVDVITYDGRAWQDTPTRFHFNWDTSRYANPRATNDQLKALGYHICCWEYPLVSVENNRFSELSTKGYFLKNAQNETYVFHWDAGTKTSPFGRVLTPLPPSGIIDFTNPAAYQWWHDQHRILFDLGCDTIKSDFGEQVPHDAFSSDGRSGRQMHNVYSHLYNRCVWQASQAYFGDQACLWGRAGWIGAQRFPVQWGGDPQSDWEGLACSIRGGLSWGLSGAPYHATDVGGFFGAKQPEPALYLRWVQAAVFSSHFRVHGIGPREPWAFGPDIETICRQFFQLRYALLPYLKKACDEAAETAIPVMRAMVLAFPTDPLAWNFEHQFMCGPSLLVAPVLNTASRVRVYLPSLANETGSWIDAWTGQAFTGGQCLDLTVELNRIPVFIRAGDVLEYGPSVQHTGELLIPAGQPTQITGRFADFRQLGIF